MSEPIKVGDLVQIVRITPCCGSTHKLGLTFVVTGFGHSFGCTSCSAMPESPVAFGSGNIKGTRISRLKRIPPLSDLEGQRTQEDLREPA